MKKEDLLKANQVFIFIAAILAGLYFGASLLIPFTLAVLFSTLVLPVSNLLENKFKLKRITSSFISTFLVFIVVGILSFLFIQQFTTFVKDIIDKQEDILAFIRRVQDKIAAGTGFPLEEQEQMLRGKVMGLLDVTQRFITSFLKNLTGILLSFLIILVYTFLLLLNRRKLIDFMMKYTDDNRKEETREIIQETTKVAYGYLWGRIQVMISLAIMYAIVFFSYGLPYAGLLIIFGTLITIIPYIGPALSGILPIICMIVYGDSLLEILSFTAIVLIIQLIESYVLEPLLIGSEVSLSPLFVIIAVLLGGALWGSAGLILFVPIFAVLKILFDHSSNLKPVGTLMGYERAGSGEGFVKKIKRKIGL